MLLSRNTTHISPISPQSTSFPPPQPSLPALNPPAPHITYLPRLDDPSTTSGISFRPSSSLRLLPPSSRSSFFSLLRPSPCLCPLLSLSFVFPLSLSRSPPPASTPSFANLTPSVRPPKRQPSRPSTNAVMFFVLAKATQNKPQPESPKSRNENMSKGGSQEPPDRNTERRKKREEGRKKKEERSETHP